jgi:hypothetical protein
LDTFDLKVSNIAMEHSDLTLRYRPEHSWKQIILSEIVKVTGAMRRNQRWSIDTGTSSTLMGDQFLEMF